MHVLITISKSVTLNGMSLLEKLSIVALVCVKTWTILIYICVFVRQEIPKFLYPEGDNI